MARGTFAESATRRPRPREVEARNKKAARREHQGGFPSTAENQPTVRCAIGVSGTGYPAAPKVETIALCVSK